MTKILGIDTGTNSLGWAVVNKEESANYDLTDKGVLVFQEGVKIEKGIESSKAADRTAHRSQRKGYYRRKIRKIRLLRVLSDARLCPPLSSKELSDWRLKNIYPENELFLSWQSTDDHHDVNPYHYRHQCLHKSLNLNDLQQRYILGRAFYHISQRRGFLSNRKDVSNDKESGKVKQGISSLTEAMSGAGCEYLGDYFYSLYRKGEKIRNHYTARGEHYMSEFNAICEKQRLDAELVEKLKKAIFSQRPLKSQKQLVGRCVFEKKKARCMTSHPLFEEYRMLAFINNIKIKTPEDEALRPLNDIEREKIMPLFYRKSKQTFDFEDIAKSIAGKGNYGYYKKEADKPYLFNYYPDSSVSGCFVTAQLREIFGEKWEDTICACYTKAGNKTKLQIINDIWHALTFYTDDDKLAEFARNRLQLNEEEAVKFSKIKTPQAYASLSLCAINKILPFLRQGLILPHAVFLANLGAVMPPEIWNVKEKQKAVIEQLMAIMDDYDPKIYAQPLDVCIKSYLKDKYNLTDDALQKLYHPSKMDWYPKAQRNSEGIYQLGSPRIDSVRNPMAMRSMFQIRHLVNRLLKEKKVDEDTEIHIELARELNDANKRQAIRRLNRENEKKRQEYRKSIMEVTGNEPTEDDLLKYELWEEQNHTCVYTGKGIGLADFLGPDPKFDIEHTIPQSVGGDSTKMNLTLCDNYFNRKVKRTLIPTELPKHYKEINYEEILLRIKAWKEKGEEFAGRARRLRTNGSMSKEQKDSIIQQRHYLIMQRDYWLGKYNRFEMTEVPEGFSRRQGTDINVISRYALAYLKSVFKHVYTRKGITTSDFRKMWGIQEEYTKKERINHVHHCIDAIVVACMGQDEYNQLAAYYHDNELRRWDGNAKAHFEKPWPTFVEDLKNISNEILVAHRTQDNIQKQGRRRILIAGKRTLCKGDAARGSLHNDTYYGAVETPEGVKYVIRRQLNMLKVSDLKNIVDPTVREIIEKAVEKEGDKALQGTIWMNEEKQIPIKKVRCFAPSVTNPLHIRSHRNPSSKEYKQQFHVANDRNYLMALYIGHDTKGKEKRDFKIINMLQAAKHYRTSERASSELIPQKSDKGYPLAYTLKIGTMVLLYEKSAEEIWEATDNKRVRRLYKVTGLSSMTIPGSMYGKIVLTHSQEARPSTEIKAKNGKYEIGEELRPSILMLHTQINALVEGYDFYINELGEIIPINK